MTHDMARFHKWIHRKSHLFEYAVRLLDGKDAAEKEHGLAWAQHYLGMRVGLRSQEIPAALAEYRRMVKAGDLKVLPFKTPKHKSDEEHKTEKKVEVKTQVNDREVAWDPKKGWVYLDSGKKVPKKLRPAVPAKMPN